LSGWRGAGGDAPHRPQAISLGQRRPGRATCEKKTSSRECCKSPQRTPPRFTGCALGNVTALEVRAIVAPTSGTKRDRLNASHPLRSAQMLPFQLYTALWPGSPAECMLFGAYNKLLQLRDSSHGGGGSPPRSV
jgi:hypothetical protein